VSRFGIDPKSLQIGVHAAEQEVRTPVCRPCSEAPPDHGRCPTVLSEYGGVIDSTFDCPCYRQDEASHRTDFERRQVEFEEARDGAFGRSDWDSEGRQAWDSVDGQFDW
jgi:hypothetical protein